MIVHLAYFLIGLAIGGTVALMGVAAWLDIRTPPRKP